MNGESLFFFGLHAIKTKTSHEQSITVKVFARCAQFLLATKIGGATAIQKYWLKKAVRSWGPVATSIRLVPCFKF